MFFIAVLMNRFKCQKSYDCLIDLLTDKDYKLQAAALNGLRFFYQYDDIEEHVRPFLDSEHEYLAF